MKKILTLILCFSVAEVSFAVTPPTLVKIGPLFRDADGMVSNFDYYDFYGDVCQLDGYRLPTIKELALGLNPKGVYEKPVPGLELQTIYTIDGAIDFYYDDKTYVQDPADKGRYLIRTSSVFDPYSPRYRFSSEGKIQPHRLGYTISDATRCAMPPRPTNPILTDLAKWPDGTLVIRDQENAEKYCREKGTRSPKARELALFAQSLGAQGISETPQNGYDLIEATGVDGKEDRFYYNAKGYIQPGGDYGGVLVWSNSKTKNPHFRLSVWGQRTEDGTLFAGSGDHLNAAVRCTVR